MNIEAEPITGTVGAGPRVEQKGTIIFRPHGRPEIAVSSPEELAINGIGVHPDVMINNWGPDAVERYRQAAIRRPVSNSGSIPTGR